MSRKPVDLRRVRAARSRLDALAADHPEAFADRSAEQWSTILREDQTMTHETRQPRAEPSVQIAIRLPESTVAALDAYAREHAQPGLALTRSDALRMILASALRADQRSR